jgi:endonuclease G
MLITRLLMIIALFVSFAPPIVAQTCLPMTVTEQANSLQTHIYGGISASGSAVARRGYVMEYDADHRVPRWAAWLAAPSFRAEPRPDRDVSRWGRFRPDLDVTNPVVQRDYNGLHASSDNYARGHIVPFYISGGDRDGDGSFAADAQGNQIVDLDDACTVFEIMFMSNIAPQQHHGFNGSGGLWNQLETIVRDRVDSGASFHLFAGTIFGEEDVQFVGPDDDIGVPDMFYKIVVSEHGPVGFLFVHKNRIGTRGCALDAELENCIVPISVIEGLTGLDFFSELPDHLESDFEAIEGSQVWDSM